MSGPVVRDGCWASQVIVLRLSEAAGRNRIVEDTVVLFSVEPFSSTSSRRPKQVNIDICGDDR